MSDKKQFKSTKFGKWLTRAGESIKDHSGDILEIGATALVNPGKAVSDAISLIAGQDSSDPKIRALQLEIQARQMDFELEIKNLEFQDRDSARKREIEVAKTGKSDLMMYATGASILVLLITVVFAVLFFEIKNSDVAHLLIGEIVGLGAGLVYYYFGTSKSSNDKNKLIDRLKQ